MGTMLMSNMNQPADVNGSVLLGQSLCPGSGSGGILTHYKMQDTFVLNLNGMFCDWTSHKYELLMLNSAPLRNSPSALAPLSLLATAPLLPFPLTKYQRGQRHKLHALKLVFQQLESFCPIFSVKAKGSTLCH
jgi:hypothetical protein